MVSGVLARLHTGFPTVAPSRAPLSRRSQCRDSFRPARATQVLLQRLLDAGRGKDVEELLRQR